MANPNESSQRAKPIDIGLLSLFKPIFPYLFLFVVLSVVLCVIWLSGVHDIEPGEIGIVSSKTGKEVSGKIVVEIGEKGIWRPVLSEGRYWFNPVTYDVDIVGTRRYSSKYFLKVNRFDKASPVELKQSSQKNYYSTRFQEEQVKGVLEILPGTFGVVNCKSGWLSDEENTLKNQNLGQIVSKGCSGIWKDPIPPGVYRFHPQVYEISIYPEVDIPPHFMGVVTRRQGKELPPGRILAREGEKGPLEEVLAPGRYRLNPELYEVRLENEIEIAPKKIGVVVAREGNPLPPGEALADRKKGQKGVWRDVLPPGTYRINPLAYEVKIENAIEIESGKVGVMIALVGKELPQGENLASPGYKGILKDILVPGVYRLNPVEYRVEKYPEILVKPGHVGIQTSKVGKNRPKVAGEKFVLVDEGERGVMKEVLPPGRYYLNPYEREVKIVDARSHIYIMKGPDAITFPAKGFDIQVNTFFEWQIDPTRLAEVVTTIGTPDEIIEKVIRPQARSIGRLEGSSFGAKELIIGNSREIFQENFEKRFREYCSDKGIVMHRVLIESIEVPESIRRPINEQEIAIQEKLKIEQEEQTAISAAELARYEEKVEQERAKILAETERLVARLEAERGKEIAEISAEKEKEIIRIGKERAEIEAEKEKEVAEVEANLLREVAAVNKERDLISAETSKQSSKIGLVQAKLEAKGIEVLNDAKAYSARIKYLADGGLRLRIQAWKEVMGRLAQNPKLVPEQLIQVDSKQGGGTGMLDAFMAIITKELAEKSSSTNSPTKK